MTQQAVKQANGQRTEKFAQHHHDVSVSLGTPAVRMLVVEVAVMEDGESWHTFHPVVAIECRVRKRFWRQYDSQRHRYGPNHTGDAKALTERGWTQEGQDIERTALFLDDDGCLSSLDDPWVESVNGKLRLVVSPWPEAEDEQRLKSVVDGLLRSLKPAGATDRASVATTAQA